MDGFTVVDRPLTYVSVKTIEFHLGNIFRTLGVRNRTELARRIGLLS